jgi:hypothetical protein
MALSTLKVAKAIYKFAVDGTASGDVVIANTEAIPSGAIVTAVYTRETTAMVGSTDIDITVGGGGVNDLVVAIDFTGDSGMKSRLTPHPLFTDTNTDTIAAVSPIVIGTAGNITLHNDGAAITAGVLEIYVEFMF